MQVCCSSWSATMDLCVKHRLPQLHVLNSEKKWHAWPIPPPTRCTGRAHIASGATLHGFQHKAARRPAQEDCLQRTSR